MVKKEDERAPGVGILIRISSEPVCTFAIPTQDPVKEVASLQLLHNSSSGGHPGVEELYEAMRDDTTLYKISAWYSGGELFDLSPLPEEAAKPVFAQILDALKFVHTQGDGTSLNSRVFRCFSALGCLFPLRTCVEDRTS